MRHIIMFARLFLAFFGLTNAFVLISSQNIDDLYFNQNSKHVKSLKDYASRNARTFNVFDYGNNWNSLVRQLKEKFGQNDMTSAAYLYHRQQQQLSNLQPEESIHDQNHVKTVIITKHIAQPYKIETEKRIPYYLKVPVEKPYAVVVPKPYTVTMEKPFPYPVKVYIPQPFAVEKEVPVPVKIPVEKPVPYIVPKPYPVYKEKIVNYAVENPIYYPVKVPVERPYPVHIPVEKKVPYTVEKEVSYPVYVPQDRPVPVPVEKPYPVSYEKQVPYPVEKPVPVAVPIPVKIPVGIPIPVHIVKHEPIFIPVNEHSEDQDSHEQNNVQTFSLHSYTTPAPTAQSISTVENNFSSAINVPPFDGNFVPSNVVTPGSESDNSFDGSANVAQSVPAPTTTINDADEEDDDAVTELAFTSTSQSNLTVV